MKEIDVSMVPQLDDSLLNRSLGNNLAANHNNSYLNESIGENKLIGRVRNLERFCNEVVSNKLFWTPDVLNFF